MYFPETFTLYETSVDRYIILVTILERTIDVNRLQVNSCLASLLKQVHVNDVMYQFDSRNNTERIYLI